MPGLGDLFGRHGVLEQLLLWGLLNQVLGAEFGPLLTALSQDISAAHPLLALPPGEAADLAARSLMGEAEARAEAAKGGIDAARFAVMLDRARVRLSPGDVAEAILRSYMSAADGEAEVRPQGVDAGRLRILTDLAGDAPGPQQLAAALRRGLIPRQGRGAGSTTYDQGIAESRLHDKWGTMLFLLSEALPTPPELAEAVVRNFTSHGDAVTGAEKQGASAAYLDLLIHLAGDAPGPQQLAEALRRGLIPRTGLGPGSASFAQGIAEGRLADKWAPLIEGLSRIWPTPVDALDAALKGQITPAEGKATYERLGGDPEFYAWLLASIGNSPTPLEAGVLAARGIIAEHGTGPQALSYDQAVLESRYRNKWGPAYRELGRHLPPPSTIVTMLAHRALDTAQAHELLLQNDMDPATAAAYVAEAEYEAISDYRGLTQSAVIDLYVAHMLTRDQAATILAALHVSPAAAAELLDYADLRYLIDSVNRSVQRIATLFTGRKISAQTATESLLRLGIPPATVDQIIGDWEIQSAADVKTLTSAEIVSAWYYGNLDDAEALASLEAIGYTPFDAWVLLSNKAKGPLPGKPARTVAQPATTVIPGVT